MKKVRVKMNKALAVMLSALMVCPSVSMGSVLADAASPSESLGSVLDDTDADASTGESDTAAPSDDANVSSPVDGTEPGTPADGTDANAPTDGAEPGAPADETNADAPVDDADVNTPADDAGAPANGADANMPVEGADNTDADRPAEDTEQSVFAVRADGAYIFSYDAETAAEAPLGLTLANQFQKTNALLIPANGSVEIPFEGTTISTGTTVFDMEFCPASSVTQNVVFKNSKDEILFVLCVNSSSKKLYLSDAEGGSELVSLGSYTGNTWCRLRTELFLDDSKDGTLHFAVSASYYANASNYSADASAWTTIASVTQEELLKVSGGDNGTVSAADGSADHPFDLAAITVSNKGSKARWIGDMYLYSITDTTLSGTLPEQTAGEAFVPGDAAVEVTYSSGIKETLALKDMLCGVDYTIEGFDSSTEAAESVPVTICYGGYKLSATVKVTAPVVTMTGIRVKTEPTKKNYKVGETFDSTGLVVEAVYSNDTASELAAESYELSSPDMNTSGSPVVTITYKDDTSMTCTFKIRVLNEGEEIKSQSFYYIDADDISDLGLEASAEDILGVAADDKGSNTTNKIRIGKGSVTKTLEQPITTGKVTFETAGYHNSAIFGIKILDSQGNALVNYAQQTSGNLNMYKGTAITGATNTINLASSKKNKWIKVVTEIDLDASNEKGALQFEMSIYYKDAYTDAEWKLEKTVTQKEAFLDYNVTSGCSTEGLTTFDIGALQFESQGTSYVDDIYFNDGNGIEGIVTTTKTLQSIRIETPATLTEFPQGSTLNTAGLVLMGTYLIEYSDGRTPETKELKINQFDTEYDFSEIKEESVVTIKVKDGENVFTESYTVKVTPKADNSYVMFSYTDEEDVKLIGFDGSKISVTGSDIGVEDTSNTGNKIKLDKGTSTLKLAEALTSGTVHFETCFLTTANSGASLFMRILNSEGKPMIDLGQYGSSNLNLYQDKKTSGDFAARFPGLPVQKWARAEIDIDLDKTNELGHLVFDATVWTTDDYGSEEWTKFAEFDQDVYINSTTFPNENGTASTTATKFDVAAIELQNAGGTNYYDDMFFEAVNGNAKKVLSELKIVSPAEKTEYYVGDTVNTKGLVLSGIYDYTFSDGTTKQTERRVMKYVASLDSSEASESALVTISAGGQTVTYTVTVLPNSSLDGIEEYFVSYINNPLVTLGEENVVKVNKRQLMLPAENAEGDKLSWEVVSGSAEIAERILTVHPSTEGATEVELQVTLFTVNEDGNDVEVKKTIRLAVPKDSERVVDDSFTTEESIKNAVTAMYSRGLLVGQAELKDVDSVMAALSREMKTEEIAVMLVKLFDIDTTYTNFKVDRSDVEDNAWYSKYVKAAFQLSVETKDSRLGKKEYGIGKGISKENLQYMIHRIVMIDQTTLPSDYADRMFE